MSNEGFAYLQLGGFNPAEYGLPVDPRLVLSVDEMKSVGMVSGDPLVGTLADGTIFSLPENYFCVCSDAENKTSVFTFNIDNDWTEPYGKFRENKKGVIIVPNSMAPIDESLTTLQIEDKVYRVNGGLIYAGTVPPSTETAGEVGHLYIDTANPALYQCVQLGSDTEFDNDGIELPIAFGKGWRSVSPVGAEKILSNGGAPQKNTEGANGQLYVDTSACELYQCKGYDTTAHTYNWDKVRKSAGFRLKLVSNDAPYKVLYSDGTWAVPVVGQKLFDDIVAIAVDNDDQVSVSYGLLSDKRDNIYNNYSGYTLVSDVVLLIEKR